MSFPVIGKIQVTYAIINHLILKKMMLQPGRVFTRMELLNTFQSEAFEGYERTIDVHIKTKGYIENTKYRLFILKIR